MSRVLFTENAYSILGLESSASEKEILKRSREIENLLKIDEVPEYDIDFVFSKDSRTEAKVKKAAEKLTSPNKKIIETFFWIFIKDSIDEKALKLFRDGNYVDAIDVLQSKITASPHSFTTIKNKAVLESLIFTEKAQKKYLEASIKSWKEILHSDKQWSDFKKIYKLNNPDVSDVLFNSFRKNAEKILSEFYEGMCKHEKDPAIYAAFSDHFTVHSESFEKNTLDPLLNNLNDLTRRISKYDIDFDVVGHDGKRKHVSETSAKIITKFKDTSDEITDEIVEFGDGVWQSSKVKVVRDNNAMALRRLAIDIINSSDIFEYPIDKELADGILEVAYNICSDNSVVEKKIEKDQEDFEKIESAKKFKEKFDKAMGHVETRHFGLAISEIDELLSMDDVSEETKANLRNLRCKCANANTLTTSYSKNSKSYKTPYTKKNGSDLAWLGWLILAIIIGTIWFAIHQSNQNKLNETLNICADKGISSSACKSSQSKNGVKCTGSFYITCEKD